MENTGNMTTESQALADAKTQGGETLLEISHRAPLPNLVSVKSGKERGGAPH